MEKIKLALLCNGYYAITQTIGEIIMGISEFDIEELVRGIGSLNDEADLDDYLYDKFSIDFEIFAQIIAVLMPLIVVGQSPLTEKTYSGFGKDGIFFIKQEIK